MVLISNIWNNAYTTNFSDQCVGSMVKFDFGTMVEDNYLWEVDLDRISFVAATEINK